MKHLLRPVTAVVYYCVLFLLLLNFCDTAIYSNLWAVHIKGGERRARSVAERHGFTFVDKILEDHYTFQHHQVSKRSTSASMDHHVSLHSDSEVLWFEQQTILRRVKRDYTISFNDAKWRSQWYLSRHNDDGRMLDMNVEAAWAKGYTGKGIVVTILDDGIEKNHPDLVANYDPRASRDVNGGDSDPTPRYDYTDENRHGTRCAGEVAASANNSICGVGVAFEAGIGGIRMLDGDVTDSVEAQSLSFNRNHIDVYSASWGPDDDGKTVDGPASLARRAFKEGIAQGRNGKGSIFVWASGNGGRDMDSCNCDGYTNSIYTLSISSATENGNVPWYSEACSSTLASTYSSGDVNEKQIITTDLRKRCTESHTGTSASAPLAAGIVALALQANPSLTWRDMQHLVVLSANPNNLHTDDWVVNGRGRRVSHHFGYGMMNAGKMVELAKNWTNVPAQRICTVVSSQTKSIPPQGHISIKLATNGCKGTFNEVAFLEHVQAKISLSSSWRGDLQIWLTSPMGTKATLLASRANDNSKMGFNQWAFMSTHTWGESSQGEWILEISNNYRAAKPAILREWNLVLYGIQEDWNPLERDHNKGRQFNGKKVDKAVRKIKPRHHDPAVGGDRQSRIEESKGEKSPVVPPYQYEPATYKPDEKPVFQRVKPEDEEIIVESDKDKKTKETKLSGPVVFRHGDHSHNIGNPQPLDNPEAAGGYVLPTDSDSHFNYIPKNGKTTSSASHLREFSIILYGTKTDPVSSGTKSKSENDCEKGMFFFRDECESACPYGWFPKDRECFACHSTCASCTSAKNTSCTQCFAGSKLIKGSCTSEVNVGATKGEDGLDPNTVWWLMVGGTVAMCTLVTFLLILALYYAYTQGYLCEQTPSVPQVRNIDSNQATQPLADSQHSSQQELMSSDEESADSDKFIARIV